MVLALMGQADKEWGGFGHAPKFPGSFHHSVPATAITAVKQDETALKQALLVAG